MAALTHKLMSNPIPPRHCKGRDHSGRHRARRGSGDFDAPIGHGLQRPALPSVKFWRSLCCYLAAKTKPVFEAQASTEVMT